MVTDQQKRVLLSSLDNARSFVLSALADYEEEQGNDDIARAWRWLRDNNRWPGFKTIKPKKAWQNDRKEYLWYYKEDWGKSRNGSALPEGMRGWHTSQDTYYSESRAFEAVIDHVAAWLKEEAERAIT